MSKRVTLNVSTKLDQKVSLLAAELEINKSEAIRRLVGMGLAILREVQLGNTITTVDANGKAMQIIFSDM